jgi:O-antigen ligase
MAAQSGASVVETAAGARWLRAYGATPHPNILGGLLTALLLPLCGLYLRGVGRWNGLLLTVILLGTAAAALSFSRSGWLGLAIGGLTLALLAWRERGSDERRGARGFELAAGIALVWLVLAALFADLFYTRTLDLGVRLEQRSITERMALRDSAMDVIRAGPITGAGTGNSVIAETALAGRRYPLEPVHNVPLLAASETGPVGGVVWVALVLALMVSLVRRAPGLDPVLWGIGAGAAALCVISLFDHYLWTHAPTRTLFWMWLGLWAAGADAQSDPLPVLFSSDEPR